MNWNVEIVIDTGGKEPAIITDVESYSANIGPCMRFLGIQLDGKSKLTCSQWIPLIESALFKFFNPKNKKALRSLEPKNRPGDVEACLDLLIELLNACKLHPKARLKWS